MEVAGASLSIALFGSARFAANGKPLDLGLSRASLTVLAYLLLFRDEPLKRDRIAFAVWPDDVETDARANLRRHLYLIARALPRARTAWFESGGRTVRWNVCAPYDLDVETFERGIAEPSTRDKALDLYAGDLLNGLDAEWLETPRNRFRELFCTAALDEARAATERRSFTRAVALSQRVLEVDPWREDAVRMLVTARRSHGDRAGALATYRDFARRLEDEIGGAPMVETQRLFETIRDEEDAVALRPAAPMRIGLPTLLNPFIGREREAGEVAAALADARIVTLTGPGGVGKSRLAVEVASRAAAFESEPIFVQLTPATDERRSIEGRMLDAFGISGGRDEPAVDVVARICGSRPTLIVVDNADRVTRSAGEVVTELVNRAPGIRFLVTSQQRLRVYGERVIVLAPLPESASVRLFLDRSKALGVNFPIDDARTEEAASICRRLDGMPLSIELAAARTNVLTLSEIDARLSDRFALLGARPTGVSTSNRTLHATLDWSFDLLDDDERLLFRRLAVFSNGWNFAAAEAVASFGSGESVDVLERLTGLIEKSLIFVSQSGLEHRYSYLETVRAYALERLRDAGELDAAHDAMRRYYARFVAERRRSTATRDETLAFDEIAAEHDNVLDVFDAARADGDVAVAATMAFDLAPFWIARGFAHEIQPRLEALLRAGDSLDVTLQAKVWNVAATALFRAGQVTEAASLADRALAFARSCADDGLTADALVSVARCRYSAEDLAATSALLAEALPSYVRAGDRAGEARVLNFMAIVAHVLGDESEAGELFRKSLLAYESCEDLQGIATLNYHLGFSAYERGDWKTAIAHSEKAFDVWHACGNLQGETWARYNLACAEAKLGFLAGAARRFVESVKTAHRRGFRREVADGFDRLAALLVAYEPDVCVRASAYAAKLRDLHGYVVLPIDRADYDAYLLVARERLGDAAFDEAWKRGTVDDEAFLTDSLAFAAESAYSPSSR